ETLQPPIGKSAFNHTSIQMASAPSGDLLRWKTKACQAASIVVSLDIARQHRHPGFLGKPFEGTFEPGRLSGPGRADNVHAQNSMFAKALPKARRQAIIFAENLLLDQDSIHHSSNSR